VITAAIIELIDTSIVNVALNDMSGNLGATLEDVAWVVTAYAIANVIIIPMTSFLAARFGRRNYYIGSILLFTAASVACGNAHNIWELVAFRFIQGIGGGALLSTSQAILFETFTVAQRGFAAALFAVGVFVGPTIGPTLGGWIIDNYSWPWIFYINLPIGSPPRSSPGSTSKEPEARAQRRARSTGSGSASWSPASARSRRSSSAARPRTGSPTRYIVVLAVVAAVSLVSFVVWELTPSTRSSTCASCGAGRWRSAAASRSSSASPCSPPSSSCRCSRSGCSATRRSRRACSSCRAQAWRSSSCPHGPAAREGVPAAVSWSSSASRSSDLRLTALAPRPDAGSGDFFWPIILRAIGLSLITIPLTQLAVSGLPPATSRRASRSTT
jgi:MFS transporter, DHA2 family, multidrug resistance protein